jgi:hypothetical protein
VDFERDAAVIDWFGVASAALWIFGLAILLAVVSIAYGLGAGGDASVRQILGQPSCRVAMASGLALFALGMFLSVDTGWEKVGWATAALLIIWEGIEAWQSWRATKGKGSEE